MSETETLAVGDSIKSLAACERIPEGAIVGFAHPVYQGAASAVRRAIADGSLHWEVTGSSGLLKTRTVKQQYGWAPFVILALPGEPILNEEVRIGYRTYGTPAPDQGHWSNGDAVHLIIDGKGGRKVAPNHNGAEWIPDARR